MSISYDETDFLWSLAVFHIRTLWWQWNTPHTKVVVHLQHCPTNEVDYEMCLDSNEWHSPQFKFDLAKPRRGTAADPSREDANKGWSGNAYYACRLHSLINSSLWPILDCMLRLHSGLGLRKSKNFNIEPSIISKPSIYASIRVTVDNVSLSNSGTTSAETMQTGRRLTIPAVVFWTAP